MDFTEKVAVISFWIEGDINWTTETTETTELDLKVTEWLFKTQTEGFKRE